MHMENMTRTIVGSVLTATRSCVEGEGCEVPCVGWVCVLCGRGGV